LQILFLLGCCFSRKSYPRQNPPGLGWFYGVALEAIWSAGILAVKAASMNFSGSFRAFRCSKRIPQLPAFLTHYRKTCKKNQKNFKRVLTVIQAGVLYRQSLLLRSRVSAVFLPCSVNEERGCIFPTVFSNSYALAENWLTVAFVCKQRLKIVIFVIFLLQASEKYHAESWDCLWNNFCHNNFLRCHSKNAAHSALRKQVTEKPFFLDRFPEITRDK